MTTERSSSRRWMIFVVGLMLAVSALACGGFFEEPTPTPTPVPTNTPQPTATPTPAATATPATQTSIELINNTQIAVCEWLIDLSGQTSFGNQLQDTQVAGGSSFTITNIAYGIYDIVASDCSGNVILGYYELELNGGELTFTLDPAVLTITNTTVVDVCGIFASPSGSSEWGQNRLPSGQTLPANTSNTLNIAAGLWDLRAEFCPNTAIDNEAVESFAQDISGTDLEWTLFIE